MTASPADIASSSSQTVSEQPKKNSFVSALTIIGMVLGLIILAIPWVVDFYAHYAAEHQIAAHDDAVQQMSEDDTERYLAEARAYNNMLIGDMSDYKSHPEYPRDYWDILNYDPLEIIGSLEIPRLSINQPLYKGTADTILEVGVGHMEGTSFPLRGKSTHAVISGHSGMPGQKMFDQLINSQVGDLVEVTIVDEKSYYMIEDFAVVSPGYSNFDIAPGENKLTLITCTPYGVNDHRLLVRCTMIDGPEDAEGELQLSDVIRNTLDLRTLPFIIGIVTTGIIIVVALVRRKRSREDHMQGEDVPDSDTASPESPPDIP